MNKTKLFLMLPLIGMLSCGKAKNEDKATASSGTEVSVTIKGSDTVLPLAQKEAEELMKTNADVSITVVGGGSGVGITAMIDGTTDIAMASRDLKTEEKMKFADKKIEIEEVIIAYDALTVIVNPANKVSKLTREQLEKIFTGEIKNWKEVGGADEKIVAYSRESSSGTYEFFKEEVMDKKNYATDILNLPATGAIVQAVGQTKGAIGYIGLAYETKEVKQLAVSYDQGKTFVEPSIASAKDKSYPISRPLFYMFDKKNADKVKTVVDYALSAEGQKIVGEIGYIPLN
ncbi:PstS family phosphate ABC transporter substrate-binding protein [Flavobacterium sp. XN-5]|uniref:Phosphate-binding protein n=1 Tax=Flavobacterium hiemivividum TaxID=2541734 RepID=A0A4R5D2E8_9FLAO|nr:MULTISPECIES: PstS family phosphate ABC transporter substrate-binding protein [Flavobacterium]NGY36382.1 PstS family phosphate ABC transporter substrate-binding protein [Flavobacterium sp. XN-5]TDE06487.1 PstS family phosphate ABC transporter substrate-binding protein [Flavobacterium hiemivividum]